MNTNELRESIRDKIVEYYHLVHDQSGQPFEPGQTPIPYARRTFDEKEMLNLTDALLDFWLTSGRYTREFEKRLADWLGVRFALLVNSGSSANLLAFAAICSPLLGNRAVQPGDEVITVAASFPTTVAPILQYNAVPVFVDVTLPYGNVDPDRLEEALSPKTRAVVLAHTLGNPFPATEIRDFCDRHGLWLIEDNCDALGSRYDGRLTGTFGHIATSSFYPPHHITMGEGGAVYTDDPILKRVLLSLRDWGRDCQCPPGQDNVCGQRFRGQFGELPPGYDHKYVYNQLGYNLKATDLQASIGCAQLDKLPDFIAARKRNWHILRDYLDELADFFLLPEPTPRSDPSWFGFMLTLRNGKNDDRGNLVRYLESCRIQTRMLFAGNLIRQPCFDHLRTNPNAFRVVGSLDQTDRIMAHSFWIGVYPGMNEEMLLFMSDEIKNFVYQGKKNG